MTKKQNKTIKEEIEREIEQLKRRDEERREEFAKALGWYDYSGGRPEPILPSWEQIFVEIGKLLDKQKFYDYCIAELENIKFRIKKLELRQKNYDQEGKENN